MSRHKKPDAPKFEPVSIAGYRQEVYSLATPEGERKRMADEDASRIILEKTAATLDRLGVLHRYLGLSGKLSENLLPLLIAVANKYVPDFEVHVGAKSKPGPRKVADRFKTVTEIEGLKIQRGLESIKEAIEVIAEERRPSISAQDLNTKYYASLQEIKACEPAAALLTVWREQCRARPDLAQGTFFDSLFWQCEREHLGATVPHNVTLLKTGRR